MTHYLKQLTLGVFIALFVPVHGGLELDFSGVTKEQVHSILEKGTPAIHAASLSELENDRLASHFASFLTGDHDKVLLAWWTSGSRAERTWILAMFRCYTDEDAAWIPSFEMWVNVFEPGRKVMRGEELDWISLQRKDLASKFSNLVPHGERFESFKNSYSSVHRSLVNREKGSGQNN